MCLFETSRITIIEVGRLYIIVPKKSTSIAPGDIEMWLPEVQVEWEGLDSVLERFKWQKLQVSILLTLRHVKQ